MQPLILISLLVFGLIVVGALVIYILTMKKSHADSNLANQEQNPQGYWVGIGISIGAGFGVALGLVFDNLGLGIAIGAGFGVAIGAALEQKNKDKIRPLTEQEKKMQRWGVALGLVTLVIGVGIFILLLLMNTR